MKKIFISLLAMIVLIPPSSVSAETTTTLIDDTFYQVGSATLMLTAGSVYSSLTVTDDTLSIMVPSGEGADLRAVGPNPAVLENDALLPACNVINTRDNRMMLNGPVEITVTPSQTNCSTSGYATDETPSFSFSSITAGQIFSAGQETQLFWVNHGRSIGSVKLRLSVDGGSNYDMIVADNLINNGYYNWTVPEVVTTNQARLKIEGYDSGRIIAIKTSEVFEIRGTDPVTPTPPAETEYDVLDEISKAETISVNKNLSTVSIPSGTFTCTPNIRLKAQSFSTLYYCGRDGKRYVFPNEKTHSTWYDNFAGVVEISDADIAKIPLGGNVTYRPGVRMIKIQTDPKVYAVSAGGVLRPIANEAVAERLYGANWNQLIDDVPDAFFTDYTIGAEII